MSTLRITDRVDVFYTVCGDGTKTQHETTHAVIVGDDGRAEDALGGPVAEEWLPGAWDAALREAGWRRTGAWSFEQPEITAAVEAIVETERWIVARVRDGCLEFDWTRRVFESLHEASSEATEARLTGEVADFDALREQRVYRLVEVEEN